MPQITTKRRASVTIAGELLDAARELNLNVSAIAEGAVRKTRAEAWQRENAKAIALRNSWIDKHGLPLAEWQVWKPE